MKDSPLWLAGTSSHEGGWPRITLNRWLWPDQHCGSKGQGMRKAAGCSSQRHIPHEPIRHKLLCGCCASVGCRLQLRQQCWQGVGGLVRNGRTCIAPHPQQALQRVRQPVCWVQSTAHRTCSLGVQLRSYRALVPAMAGSAKDGRMPGIGGASGLVSRAEQQRTCSSRVGCIFRQARWLPVAAAAALRSAIWGMRTQLPALSNSQPW